MQAWGHLWLGWNEAAIEPVGESCRNTELIRRLAGAMGYTEPALFDDDDTILVQALGSKEALDELKAAELGEGAVSRRRSPVRRRACSRRRRAASSS